MIYFYYILSFLLISYPSAFSLESVLQSHVTHGNLGNYFSFDDELSKNPIDQIQHTQEEDNGSDSDDSVEETQCNILCQSRKKQDTTEKLNEFERLSDISLGSHISRQSLDKIRNDDQTTLKKKLINPNHQEEDNSLCVSFCNIC